MSYLSKIKLLYVEDENIIRESLARFLKRRIKLLYVASNGQEGLELFKKHEPDIVLTDIRMPIMDGLTMIEKINAIKKAAIVITTGHNDEKYLLDSIDLGVNKYVKKPIDQKKLLDALEYIALTIWQGKEIDDKNHFIQSVMDISPQFLMVTEDSKISYMNKSFLNFLGFNSLEEMVSSNKTIDDFLVVKSNEFYKNKIFEEWIEEIFIHPDIDYVMNMKSAVDPDEIYTYLVRVNEIPDRRYLFSFSDITLVEIIKLLYHELAIKDSLTRIYNRRKFLSELEREIERSKRYKHKLSLIMFDIDYFKQINDTYGHQVGDNALQEIVRVALDSIRQQDILGRYGGEEFMIFLPETPANKTTEIAERLRHKIESFQFKHFGNLTCSFGVTEYNAGESLDDLIKRVDEALYIAKDSGRNCVEEISLKK